MRIDKDQLKQLISTAIEADDPDAAFKWAAVYDAFFRYDSEDAGSIQVYELPSPAELRGMANVVNRAAAKVGVKSIGEEMEFQSTWTLESLADRIEELAVRTLDKGQADAIKKVMATLERSGVKPEDMPQEIVRILDGMRG